MKKISLVVSVYNEEAVLDKFYENFLSNSKNFLWDYELVFVNDGSMDASQLILEKLAMENPKIKVISFSRNFGHESAMIAGIDYATGDGIVCMDADLQHPIECVNEIISKLEEGYEVINMVRLANKSAGILKNLTSKLFYKVINAVSENISFEENASDFFAVSARVADILKNNYREKTRFLRGYVQSVGFKKTTIEYVAPERAAGESHYSIKKLAKYSFDTIVSFSNLPLKLGVYAGAICWLIGLVVFIDTLRTKYQAPNGYPTIVILICFMFAVLFTVIGIIGQYLAVLFSETKDRPIYIVDKKINFDEE